MRFDSYMLFLGLAVFVLAGPIVGQESARQQTDFLSIFDGQSLDGWSGNSKFWSVEDGAITGQTTADNPTDGNTFLIWQGDADGKEIGDFELRLKYRIQAGNSGVQFRSKDLGDHRVAGYQADIDAGNNYTGIMYDERGRGILARRTQQITIDESGKKSASDHQTCDEQKLLASLKKDGWNEYVIRANGNHLVQTLNGHVTVDVTDRQTDKSKSAGILALQLHAGPPMKIQFKDIQLKRLTGDE